MGRRVWEMNKDWRGWPPQNRQTDIYLPQQVAHDFRRTLGTWDHLAYFEKLGLIRLIELTDGDTVMVGNTHIRPFRLAENYVYAFVFEGDGKRVLIAPDELLGWEPPAEVRGADLAIIPMGIAEFDPFTGERRIPESHPLLQTEATYLQTLEIIRKLDASLVAMTHIEEVDGLTYDNLKALEGRLQEEGLNIVFAYDTMLIDV
jgi:phosphoribosyl 1,2-cyclic phosphate phosphodiesterase